MYLTTKPKSLKYRQLLLVLIVNLTISPFLEGMIGSLIASILFFYGILVVIKSLTLPKLFFKIYLIIAMMAFVLELLANIGWITSSATILVFIAQGIYSTFLGISIILIFREIYTASRVTIDTIQGGICIYLMLGLIWALFYGMTATIDVNAFSTSFLASRYSQIIYFSFSTLTTLGYGDIAPVSKLAQMLANIEAIVGQLYPTIFIAMLVGGYLSQNRGSSQS